MSIKHKKKFKFLSFLGPFIAFLSLFYKRDENKWGFLINDNHGLDRNLRALFDYAYRHPELTPFIVDARYADTDWISEMYPDVEILPHASVSLGALKTRLTCGRYIVTHSPRFLRGPYKLVPKVRVINIWHAISLKGMGNLDANANRQSRTKLHKDKSNIDLFCAASETERGLIAGCFFFDGDQIAVTGSPRNDWLLCHEDQLPSDLRALLANLDKELNGRKLVLYAPTWRDYDRGVVGFDKSSFRQLCKFLEENNAVLGIRSHPKDKAVFNELLASTELAVDLSYAIVPETNVLLRKTDVLITDYSGIWIDYLLLKRPVMGYVYDYDTYQKTRGLMYDFETVFPGMLSHNVDELIDSIRLALSDETYTGVERLQWVEALFHQYKDFGFCERVREEIARLN